MSRSVVSVVMPVWRPRADHLREAIRSVLAQTLGDLELIVVEDPSPAPASAIVAEFGDPRIRHIMNASRTGLAEQRNRGVHEARAGIVACADADDVNEPERLATQLDYLERHPEVAVLGAQLSVIDTAGGMLGRRDYPRDHDAIVRAMRRRNPIAQPAVVMRRDVVLAAGGYRPSRHSDMAEDYDLWCRLARRSARFANHPERLVRYRLHDQASKHRLWRELLRATIEIKREHFASELTVGDRVRIAAERLLLLAPTRVVATAFRALSIKRSRSYERGGE